jgi:hypothetical protein
MISVSINLFLSRLDPIQCHQFFNRFSFSRSMNEEKNNDSILLLLSSSVFLYRLEIIWLRNLRSILIRIDLNQISFLLYDPFIFDVFDSIIVCSSSLQHIIAQYSIDSHDFTSITERQFIFILSFELLFRFEIQLLFLSFSIE